MMDRRGFLRTLGLSVALAGTGSALFLIGSEQEIKEYEVHGQSIFPLTGEDGALSGTISFLMCREGNQIYSFGYDPSKLSFEDAKQEFTREMRTANG